MKSQSGTPYNLPTNPPSKAYRKGDIKIDVYQRMSGYEVYQKNGDAPYQRMALNTLEMNNFFKMITTAGFTEV
jgi:hypothetical protein